MSSLRILAWYGFVFPLFANSGVAVLDSLPFRFEANHGQAKPPLRFIARGRGYTLGLTEAGSEILFFDTEHRRFATVRTRIAGANPRTALDPVDRQATETNYIHGNDPAGWLRNVPSWNRVK